MTIESRDLISQLPSQEGSGEAGHEPRAGRQPWERLANRGDGRQRPCAQMTATAAHEGVGR